MNPPKWTIRALVVATGVAVAFAATPRAVAQQPFNPGVPFRGFPPGVIVHPQINTLPRFNGPVWGFNPDPFFAPNFNNPFANQFRFGPPNPFAVNPFNNPFAVNPFAPNPFAPNPFNNPFANNPLNNPFNNPIVNPQGLNPFPPVPFPNQFAPNPFVPAGFFAPPIAIQQAGFLQWRAPDLQVNPWSGTVVKPFTGVARTADGSIFFQLSRSGVPTVFPGAGPRTGVYFNPEHGTFLNPTTGVIFRPGGANVFLPWTP